MFLKGKIVKKKMQMVIVLDAQVATHSQGIEDNFSILIEMFKCRIKMNFYKRNVCVFIMLNKITTF